jgi:hypothetical protein
VCALSLMGSSVSLLPDTLVEDNLITLCGDEYSPFLYPALKNDLGEVTKDFFVSCCSPGVEGDGFRLFLRSANQGVVEKEEIPQMFVRVGIFLTDTQIDCIIQHNENSQESSGINYFVFRKKVIPSVATHQGIDPDYCFLLWTQTVHGLSTGSLMIGESSFLFYRAQFVFR